MLNGKENFEIGINTNKNTYFAGETIHINPYFKNNTFIFVKVEHEIFYPISIQIFDENMNMVEAIPSLTSLVGMEKFVAPYSKYKSNPININIIKPGKYEIVGKIVLFGDKREIIGRKIITVVEK